MKIQSELEAKTNEMYALCQGIDRPGLVCIYVFSWLVKFMFLPLFVYLLTSTLPLAVSVWQYAHGAPPVVFGVGLSVGVIVGSVLLAIHPKEEREDDYNTFKAACIAAKRLLIETKKNTGLTAKDHDSAA